MTIIKLFTIITLITALALSPSAQSASETKCDQNQPNCRLDSNLNNNHVRNTYLKRHFPRGPNKATTPPVNDDFSTILDDTQDWEPYERIEDQPILASHHDDGSTDELNSLINNNSRTYEEGPAVDEDDLDSEYSDSAPPPPQDEKPQTEKETIDDSKDDGTSTSSESVPQNSPPPGTSLTNETLQQVPAQDSERSMSQDALSSKSEVTATQEESPPGDAAVSDDPRFDVDEEGLTAEQRNDPSSDNIDRKIPTTNDRREHQTSGRHISSTSAEASTPPSTRDFEIYKSTELPPSEATETVTSVQDLSSKSPENKNSPAGQADEATSAPLESSSKNIDHASIKYSNEEEENAILLDSVPSLNLRHLWYTVFCMVFFAIPILLPIFRSGSPSNMAVDDSTNVNKNDIGNISELKKRESELLKRRDILLNKIELAPMRKELAELSVADYDRSLKERKSYLSNLKTYETIWNENKTLTKKINMTRYGQLQLLRNLVNLKDLPELTRDLEWTNLFNSLKDEIFEKEVEMDFLEEQIRMFRQLSQKFHDNYLALVASIEKELIY